MDPMIATRHPGRPRLAPLLAAAALLAAGPAVAARAASHHHKTAPAQDTTVHPILGDNAAARAAARPDPTVDPDNPPAPPPPDGYQVVQDEDVTAQSFSPRVTATGGPGLPSIEARQTPREANNVPSHFSLFGVPVKFNAPVAPPYNASFMYSTYAGQPGRGYDAPSAEGAAGQP